jgi:hypothetical protein
MLTRLTLLRCVAVCMQMPSVIVSQNAIIIARISFHCIVRIKMIIMCAIQFCEWQRWVQLTLMRRCNTQLNFEGVSMVGLHAAGACFRAADLRGVDLRGAELSGADFSHANLSEANLSNVTAAESSFHGAVLVGCDLSRTQISRLARTHCSSWPISFITCNDTD